MGKHLLIKHAHSLGRLTFFFTPSQDVVEGEAHRILVECSADAEPLLVPEGDGVR